MSLAREEQEPLLSLTKEIAMKGMKALLTATGFVAALAMAGPAAAQLYIGATIGQAEYKEGCLGTGECDDADTAWRILGGFQFNKFFAVELGYYDFGEASSGTAKLEAEAFELVAVGSFHFTDRFSVYGKLGGYQGTLKGGGVDEDSTDLTYGIGVRWDFTKRLGVRGEWQRYESLGGGSVETDLDVLSIGLIFQFQ
jgi:OmpA-OmpF porin, OOP family